MNIVDYSDPNADMPYKERMKMINAPLPFGFSNSRKESPETIRQRTEMAKARSIIARQSVELRMEKIERELDKEDAKIAYQKTSNARNKRKRKRKKR